MPEFITRTSQEEEYFFEEGCFIVELANSATDPAVSIARARVPVGQTTRWHRLQGIHERYLVLAGNGLVEVGDHAPAEVGPGDVVNIDPGVAQRIHNAGDDELLFLAICAPRFLPSAYEDLQEEHNAR